MIKSWVEKHRFRRWLGSFPDLASSVANLNGDVMLRGRARVTNETRTSPSGKPCIAFSVVVHQRLPDDFGRLLIEKTTRHGQAVDFVLALRDGDALIRPAEKSALHLRAKSYGPRFATLGRAPLWVQPFLAAHGAPEILEGSWANNTRWQEGRIEDGDEVWVYGRVHREADGGEARGSYRTASDRVVILPPPAGMIISDGQAPR